MFFLPLQAQDQGGRGVRPPPGEVSRLDEPSSSPDEGAMTKFLSEVSKIKARLQNIRNRQRTLSELHERTKTATRSEDITTLRDQMQSEMSQVSALAQECKARLDQLDTISHEVKIDPESAEARTRASLSTALRRKLKEIMGDFAVLRDRVHEEHKEVVERRVLTVTGIRPSEEQVEELIESGESDNIFQRAILEQGRGHILDTLAEISERHAAIRDLERSLLDLHQIFLDMAVLVEAQGELVENIANHVKQTVNYVHKGTKSLQAARRLQLNTRKWMCIGIILTLIVAVITVGAMQPWKK